MSRAALPYRPDIDGLRAVAVAAVLVFHVFQRAMPGGFVGVDIFFVISGFLISGIILKELEGDRFTFAGFYARRIRRIFPALSLVLAITLLLGWAMLGPGEFRQLSKHTMGGAGFVSNLMLWTEAGYFDPAAQWKPLLHLWSLGIEEQFYIGWPLLLAALFRRTRKVLLAVGLVALLSFCFNVATVSGDPVSVFYSPAARIWELLIGAGLTCYLAKGGRRLKGFANEGAAVLGCVLIAASTILMNSRTPFPGWWALPPTLGAATLILTADAWINRRVLASRGFVFLGLISYPVYLWHWPLLTFFRLVNESDLHLSPVRVRLIRIALLVLPCFLAWGTWRFWETPVRRAKTVGRLPTIPALTIAMTAVFMAAMLGALGWIPPRLNSPEVKRIFQATLDRGGMPYNNFLKSDFRATEFRSGNPEVTLFAGDSHAEQYAPRVRTAIEHNAGLASAAFLIHGGCPPLPGLNPQMPGFDCPKFYRFWTSAAARARTVVIAAYWEMYFTPPGTTGPTGARLELVTASGTPVREADIDGAWRGLEHAIRGWIGDGKRVVLLLSSPASKSFNPMRALRRFGRTDLALLQPMRYDEFERFLSPVEEPLKVLAASTGAELIRTADYFCESGMCPPVDAQGEPIYVDDNHLRARTVVQKAVFIDDLLRR